MQPAPWTTRRVVPRTRQWCRARAAFDAAPSSGERDAFPHEHQAAVARVPFDVSGVITYAVIDHPNQAVVLDFVEFDRDGTGRACSRTFTRASRTVLSRVCMPRNPGAGGGWFCPAPLPQSRQADIPQLRCLKFGHAYGDFEKTSFLGCHDAATRLGGSAHAS